MLETKKTNTVAYTHLQKSLKIALVMTYLEDTLWNRQILMYIFSFHGDVTTGNLYICIIKGFGRTCYCMP